jgi:hypothetical protein
LEETVKPLISLGTVVASGICFWGAWKLAEQSNYAWIAFLVAGLLVFLAGAGVAIQDKDDEI